MGIPRRDGKGLIEQNAGKNSTTSAIFRERFSFVPTVHPSGGGDFTSVTYSEQFGEYERVGDSVVFSMKVSWSAITIGPATGQVWLRMTGLPLGKFTNTRIIDISTENVVLPASTVGVVGTIANLTPPGGVNDTYLACSGWLDNASELSVVASSLAAGGTFNISGSYIAE